MKLSAEKTEICLFSRGNTNDVSLTLKVNLKGKEISYNPNPKVLGLYLDESLNFQNHIKRTEQKANKAVGILRQIKHVEKISTFKLVQLYKSLICPILEYACPVWQIADAKMLEEVQRKALSLCLDCYATSGREAMEVELGASDGKSWQSEKELRLSANLNKSLLRRVGFIGKKTLIVRSFYLPSVKFNYSLKIFLQKQEPPPLILSQSFPSRNHYNLPRDDQNTGIDWAHQNRGLKNSKLNPVPSFKGCWIPAPRPQSLLLLMVLANQTLDHVVLVPASSCPIRMNQSA